MAEWDRPGQDYNAERHDYAEMAAAVLARATPGERGCRAIAAKHFSALRELFFDFQHGLPFDPEQVELKAAALAASIRVVLAMPPSTAPCRHCGKVPADHRLSDGSCGLGLDRYWAKYEAVEVATELAAAAD